VGVNRFAVTFAAKAAVDQLKPALLQPVPAPFRCKKAIRGINPQQRRAFSRQHFACGFLRKRKRRRPGKVDGEVIRTKIMYHRLHSIARAKIVRDHGVVR